MAMFWRKQSAPSVVVIAERARDQRNVIRHLETDLLETDLRQFGPEAAAAVDKNTEEGKSVYPDLIYFVWALLAIVLGVLFGTVLYEAKTGITFNPPEGVGIFALFYLVAQVVERVQEPLTPFLGRAKSPDTQGSGKSRSKNQVVAKAELENAVTEARKAPTEENAMIAANKQRTTDQISANLTVLMFAGASLLTMLLLGYLKAGLLTSLGVSNVEPWIDVFASGLIIGAGTKPLHDLISKLSASKDADKQSDDKTSTIA
jgi:hypothetical protein